MAKTRWRKRRMWTSNDIRALREGARKKIAAPKIARRLARTEGATRQKAFAMGISLDTRAAA